MGFCDTWLGYVSLAGAVSWCAGVFQVALPWLGTAAAAILLLRVYAHRQQKREWQKFSLEQVLGESSPQVELIKAMAGWAKSSLGGDRVAPQLLTMLDGLAEARIRASRLMPDPQPKEAGPINKLEVLAAMDLALADAIWMGRHLIRLPRQRKATFARRIAEPGFQASVLDSIDETLKEAQALVDALGKASERESTFSLREHLKKLEELHAARAELDEELEPLEEF